MRPRNELHSTGTSPPQLSSGPLYRTNLNCTRATCCERHSVTIFMRYITSTLVLFAVILLFGCDTDFSLVGLQDRIARPDSMTANIKGEFVIFSSITAGNYFGIGTTGTSGTYRLSLFLGSGSPDTLSWSGSREFGSFEPSANLNGFTSIENHGSLIILEHDTFHEYIRGIFEFAVVDSTRDTVWVKDGMFHVHYTSSD